MSAGELNERVMRYNICFTVWSSLLPVKVDIYVFVSLDTSLLNMIPL